MQGAALIKTAEFVGVGRVFQTFRPLLGDMWDTFRVFLTLSEALSSHGFFWIVML